MDALNVSSADEASIRYQGWPASLIATATTCFYLFGALRRIW